MPFSSYLAQLRATLKTGQATEPSYYPALKDLLEALEPGVTVTQNPKKTEHGSPDFSVKRKKHVHAFPVGWIEAKDIGEELNKIEKSDQLKRYLHLPNLVLTDFLEFRWYTGGQRRLTARLARLDDAKLSPDPKGEVAVRDLLLGFLAHSIPPTRNSRELARVMARLAHFIRDATLYAFEREPEGGKLHNQLQAFRETLIPDLKPDQFADMYAQTIAYGLFAAACQPRPATQAFTRERAAYLIPKTNPFLRKLFNEIAGPELDPSIQPFVEDLVALLRESDLNSILADFGKRAGKEDPVVHFYEDFLHAYDPKEKKIRGVFYTPEPVVSYIVRSIDYLLQTRFNKPDGLADKDVLILDPACGTGTFLYYVIQHIHDTVVTKKGQKGAWNSYVSENLLKRVFGFELLMAPYAVAHLKLGLLLQELGYQFDSDERLGIYLTNTLEEAIKKSELIFAQWIADEANAASEIKKEKPIMVVLGNPPYSISSLNRGPWITKEIKDYKRGLKEKKVNIDDDYIKFIRFAHWRIERTGYGILGFITNNSYLDGLVHRRMRESLLHTFPIVNILNLHGSTVRAEVAPDGGKDDNVFDIQQGVAIGLYTAPAQRPTAASVNYADLWGVREAKYSYLFQNALQGTRWTSLQPSAPHFFFVAKDFAAGNEYEKYWHPRDIFKVFQNGLKTDRDDLFLDFNSKELEARMRTLFSGDYADTFRNQYRIEASSSYDLESRIKEAKFNPDNIRLCHYRPFDVRFLYYKQGVTSRPAYKVMKHMLSDNRALILCRQVTKGDFSHCLITKWLTEISSLPNGPYNLFPLYLYGQALSDAQLDMHGNARRMTNLKPTFLKALSTQSKWREPSKEIGPEDVMSYIYAVLHSPTYRQRYAEFLKIDFPRVPLTSDKGLFRALAQKGAELVSLHLLESPKLNEFITRYQQPGDHVVQKVRFEETHVGAGLAPARKGEPTAKKGGVKPLPYPAGRVHINKDQYFDGIPKEVWEFHIGGYQVCEKWLKDRKGRKLSNDELSHYQKIVVALNETIRLMKEIDAIIPGWPLP